MTDEERQRAMDFIRDHQPRSAALEKLNNIDPEKAAADAKLADERRKLDRDMDRLERVLKRMVNKPWRRPTPSEAEKRLAKALAELAQNRSKHSTTDKRLDALNDIVRPDVDEPSS